MRQKYKGISERYIDDFEIFVPLYVFPKCNFIIINNIFNLTVREY